MERNMFSQKRLNLQNMGTEHKIQICLILIWSILLGDTFNMEIHIIYWRS